MRDYLPFLFSFFFFFILRIYFYLTIVSDAMPTPVMKNGSAFRPIIPAATRYGRSIRKKVSLLEVPA